MTKKQTRRRRTGVSGISIMRFGFHASASEAAGVATAEMSTMTTDEQGVQRCSAIYADKPCGGLIVDGDDEWPRCERCGIN